MCKRSEGGTWWWNGEMNTTVCLAVEIPELIPDGDPQHR